MVEIPSEPRRIVDYIGGDEATGYFIQGSRCSACGEVFVGERDVCGRCCARTGMMPFRVAERGRLYSYAIIHRSYPGIFTPFVDVTVDMADGTHLKGTLKGVVADPVSIAFDMPVRLSFEVVASADASEPGQIGYTFVQDADLLENGEG